MIRGASQRAAEAARAWEPLNETGAKRLLELAEVELRTKKIDREFERRRFGHILNSQIPNMFGKEKWEAGIRAIKQYSELFGLNAPKQVHVDVTGREAIRTALELSSPEELDELIEKGLEADRDDD